MGSHDILTQRHFGFTISLSFSDKANQAMEAVTYVDWLMGVTEIISIVPLPKFLPNTVAEEKEEKNI